MDAAVKMPIYLRWKIKKDRNAARSSITDDRAAFSKANKRLEPPVRNIQSHGMAAGNHTEHNGIDQCAKIDLAGFQIKSSGNDRAYGLYDEQTPGLHNTGTVQRYGANLREGVILINPQAEKTDTVSYTHQKSAGPFFSSLDHTADVLCKGVAEEEQSVKDHETEGNQERFFCRPANYIVA